MKNKTLRLILLTTILIGFCILLTGRIVAQSFSFCLKRAIVSSGGINENVEDITFHAILGQPFTGRGEQETFTLISGFWTSIVEIVEKFKLMFPIIFR